MAIATSDETVPFWMRSNQYGSIPLTGLSGSFVLRAGRDYKTAGKRLFDWGVGVEGRANIGQRTEGILTEGYAKFRIGPFELKGGRSKDQIGLADSTLSSGSFALSGNALGIPKVQLSVPEFTHLFGGRIFAFKGNLVHGWLGDVQRTKASANSPSAVPTYFHQASLYGRFGADNWKVRFYGGFNHDAFWGSEKIRYGRSFTMSDWEAFLYVAEGRMWKGISSKIGNHLGSIDLGLELNFKRTSYFLYRQNFYDVGALYYLANIKDGLNGLRILNKAGGSGAFRWKKMVLEFLYSKSQGGEPSAPNTPSGAENYYNSSEYNQGWSYQGLALGSPFFTTKPYLRTGLAAAPYQYFVNNRVMLLHTGMEGSFHAISFALKLSFSRNYGTWITNVLGARWGGNNINTSPPLYGLFKTVDQFSSYLECTKVLRAGFSLGAVVALDYGDLLKNTVGGQLKLAKKF